MVPRVDDKAKRNVMLTVMVAALGYFVDIYDLVLFSILRVPSLRGLDVPPGDITAKIGRAHV